MSWLGLIGAWRDEDDDDLQAGVERAWKHEVAAMVVVERGGGGLVSVIAEMEAEGKERLRERIGWKWMRGR